METSIYPLVRTPTGKGPDIENPAIVFPFELDDFQKHAFKAIENGDDVLVCAPTASGKTLVAQYAIAHTIKKGLKTIYLEDNTEDNQNTSDNNHNTTNRVVYATPIKVLSNQNYADLKPILNPMNMTVGISTGDIKIDEDSQCLVATAEILRNSMYQLNTTVENSRKKLDRSFADSIGCIIIDEAHYMNDKERGRVWEEIIVLANPNVLLILLSATLSNPEKFASWISFCHQRPISLITVEQRKIPLKHYLLINNTSIESTESSKKMYQFMNEKNMYDSENFKAAAVAHARWVKERQKKSKPINNPNDIPSTVKWLRDNNMLQAMFFSFSKKECEAYANMIDFDLIDHEDKHKIDTIFMKYMQPHMKRFENVGQVDTIRKLLSRGVAYHHSGMLSILKEIVEIIFKEGLAKVLFCTETFAVGINCPTRTVVFTGIEKYSNEGKRLISPAEYKQISGRAGRRGLDTNGTVIILFREYFPDEGDIKSIVLGKVPEITSNFKWDYQFFLKIIQSNVTNVDTFFKKSLVNQENELALRGMILERDKLIKTIESLEILITSFEHSLIVDANQLSTYEKQTSISMFGSITAKLPKKQQQDYMKLTKMLSQNAQFKRAYESVKNLTTHTDSLVRLNKSIASYESYVDDFCVKLRRILFKWGYITHDNAELTPQNINVKGIIAGNINECNPIILTEMICDGYFDGLTLEEIIAFVSIFTEPIKSAKRDGDTLQINNFNGTIALRQQVERLFKMINDKQIDEELEFVGLSITDWSISTDYIDIAYSWAKGTSVKDILEDLNDLEEYEGNFVKNMLKVCNIVNDIKCVCEMIGKVELLPVLENVDTLILRDIVTVTSLYLK